MSRSEPSRPGWPTVLETWRARIPWIIVAATAFAACVMLSYGFGRWWPGCEGFNTQLQQSGTAARANLALTRCPDVSVTDVRVALLVDTVFPVCYAAFGASLLVLMACSRAWRVTRLPVGRWCRRLAGAVVLAGAVDMSVENLALAIVTVTDWPPHPEPGTEYLLLTAALASWAKITLCLGAAVGYVWSAGLWLCLRRRLLRVRSSA